MLVHSPSEPQSREVVPRDRCCPVVSFQESVPAIAIHEEFLRTIIADPKRDRRPPLRPDRVCPSSWNDASLLWASLQQAPARGSADLGSHLVDRRPCLAPNRAPFAALAQRARAEVRVLPVWPRQPNRGAGRSTRHGARRRRPGGGSFLRRDDTSAARSSGRCPQAPNGRRELGNPRLGYPGCTALSLSRVALDTARHFFPVAFIKKYVELTAAYKLNTFHWHLPMIKAGGSRSKNIRSSRVSVRGTNRPEQVATTWGIHDEIFCPTETTFTFLTDVLGEVMEMFPGPLIHIGGDEVPKVRWKRSPAAQRLMKKEPLANEAALESYFLLRIGSRRKARVALRRRGHDRVDTSASRRPVGSSRG